MEEDGSREKVSLGGKREIKRNGVFTGSSSPRRCVYWVLEARSRSFFADPSSRGGSFFPFSASPTISA